MAQDNNSLILKNSIYLYLRAIVSLVLRLFTTRLVLQALGIEEFGVFQFVGGLVAMFGFLNGTLSVATVRFLAYEIGKGDQQQLKKVFSTSIVVHALLAFIVFISIEIFGAFAIKSGYVKLGCVAVSNVLWVLHFTALSSVLTITSVPYNSIILAKEDMSYFAYIDLFGVFLSFILGCSLSLFQSDRLFYYAFLTFIITLIVRLTYYWVCKKKYPELHFSVICDWKLLKQMTNFSAWTSLSSISYMIRNQGVSFVVNYFFGPVLNSAVGISNQVNQGVNLFSVNFQSAFSSQITKTYAQGNYERMGNLVISGAKLSTYLILIFAIPVMVECSYILNLWLREVPLHTDVIVGLILCETIIATMTCTGNLAIRANGKIKKYELYFNVVYMLSLPMMLLWLFFQKVFFIPFVATLIFMVLSTVVKIFFITYSIPGFDLRRYLQEVFLLVPVIASVSIIAPISIQFFVPEGMVRFGVSTLLFELSFFTIVFFIGLNTNEKKIVVSKLKDFYHKCRRV